MTNIFLIKFKKRGKTSFAVWSSPSVRRPRVLFPVFLFCWENLRKKEETRVHHTVLYRTELYICCWHRDTVKDVLFLSLFESPHRCSLASAVKEDNNRHKRMGSAPLLIDCCTVQDSTMLSTLGSSALQLSRKRYSRALLVDYFEAAFCFCLLYKYY